MSNWTKKRVFTKLEHILYSHPIPSNPDNKENYCIVTFAPKGTVAAIALTGDDKILLVEQYRPASNKLVINLPGGRIEEDDTTPDSKIKEEIEEETGYTFKKITRLYDGILFQNPTRITDETIIFVAEDVEKTSTPTSKEITERDTKVLTIELNDAKRLILNETEKIKGEYLWPEKDKRKMREIKRADICDMTTIAALSLYLLSKK